MQKRDGYSNIKSLLLEKKAKETLSLDKAIYSTQEKIGNIFGPLSRIWVFLGGQNEFRMRRSLSQFLCLCFGLSPDPLEIRKLLKVLIALLRKLKVRLIIYLDDILVMAASKEESEIRRDTLIFLLKHLGFIINVKKSVLFPTKIIEFLAIITNSIKMELSLSEEKVQKILMRCQKTLDQKLMSVREVSQLIGTLFSTTHRNNK